MQIGYSKPSLGRGRRTRRHHQIGVVPAVVEQAELVHEAAFRRAHCAAGWVAGDIAADIRMMIAATRDVFTTPGRVK